MPEGHTIHRLARGLADSLGTGPVTATSPQGRFADGAALLDGETLRSAGAWGKFLFVDFTGGQILHVHLGLIGKFRDGPAGHPSRDSIRLRLENDRVCWDLTGPQTCRLVTPDERSAITARIGADPLRRRPDISTARSKFARSTKSVGALLLDQGVISGLGNIYRAEILFLTGINPHRRAETLTDDEFDAIWAESVRLLRIGVRTGRIICTDPAEIGRPRSRMTREDAVYVYHREHCRRCGSELVTAELAGRPLQYCARCQPA